MVEHYPTPAIEQISHSSCCVRPSIIMQNDECVIGFAQSFAVFFSELLADYFAKANIHVLPWGTVCFRTEVFNPRPSGEFCSAREGYFTVYNAL